jgi:hypothetical protein
MADDTSPQPKIIVDEDWKAKVQAEKEAQQQAAEEQPSAGPAAEQALPPASLAGHVMSLASEAMIMLGQVPNPHTGKAEVHLGYARYLIDTIQMLEEKTQGQRTPEEISLFSRVLHELRMAYVAVQGKAAGVMK